MTAAVSIYGIRHHGPGSARRLVEALDHLNPSVLLIEGPADATDLVPLLTHPQTRLPVALLSYAEDDAARASFFPFAEYSPEYQAIRWGVAHGAQVRFIDLPSSDRLAETDGADAARPADPDPVSHDPIGTLARAAGYDDGESWWNDTIEENPDSTRVFESVADAMTALREGRAVLCGREAAREAHMRLEISQAAREAAGPVAVICGAWHVPALLEKTTQTADKALLKGRAKAKVRTTLAPWTSPRLATSSGYGAGVMSPQWFAHLWRHGNDSHRDSRWLTRIAEILRGRGHAVSTASLIEAVRHAASLASLRERPAPGYEELREAVISVMCSGSPALWDEISDEVLIGNEVGEIPEETPLAPLLEDLQRQQKAVRLKPEALERELALDLRTESGLARSTLLHRLTALDVPWGTLANGGKSRGTFRESWKIAWKPEYAIQLVENLVYGATILDAADTRTIDAMARIDDIADLADQVRTAMVSDLGRATAYGLAALENKAALESPSLPLLRTLPPMADIIRYGEARASRDNPVESLMPSIVARASVSVGYDSRGLDREASEAMRQAILGADSAIRLAKLNDDVCEQWRMALDRLVTDPGASRLMVGTAARILYEGDRLDPEEASRLLSRMLSAGTPTVDAAAFFEGFFSDSGPRLIHDTVLRGAVDAWMASLAEDDFVAALPLFRRVFSVMDKNERKRLMDALFLPQDAEGRGYSVSTGAEEVWNEIQDRIFSLLGDDR